MIARLRSGAWPARAHRLVAAVAIVAAGIGVGPSAAFAQPPPSLVIEAPPSLAADRARVEAYDVTPLADIVRLVGLDHPGPPIRVLLADADSDWARRVSPWTAGLAMGAGGPIVLFPARSPTYPHDTLEDVLRHEVAHVLIDRAARGQPVPRWFHEGLAVAVERQWGVEDRTRVASALLFGPRLTLQRIDQLFDGDQGTQSRGYALSAAVVRDVMAEYGVLTPAEVLRRVGSGWPFDAALASVTQRTIPFYEAEFWDRQRTWTMWVPLLASGTVLWLGVIGLATLAVRRRRRRAAEIRRRWEQEEQAVGGEQADGVQGSDTLIETAEWSEPAEPLDGPVEADQPDGERAGDDHPRAVPRPLPPPPDRPQ